MGLLFNAIPRKQNAVRDILDFWRRIWMFYEIFMATPTDYLPTVLLSSNKLKKIIFNQ